MKISIITVTYNSKTSVEHTIRSVLEQTYPDVEYIIVDGGSTDGTRELIEKYRPSLAHFISEKDRGLYDAINKGIRLASGDVIGILHSDDFYTNREVLSHYAALFETSGADAVYADLYYVSKDQPDKVIRKWKSGAFRPGSFLNGWMPPHPTFFLKKSVYERYGTYDLTFSSSADYELMLRMIVRYGVRLAYLPEFAVKMRMGGQSNASFSNRLKANLEDRNAWRINGLNPRFYTLYLKPLRKLLQFF